MFKHNIIMHMHKKIELSLLLISQRWHFLTFEYLVLLSYCNTAFVHMIFYKQQQQTRKFFKFFHLEVSAGSWRKKINKKCILTFKRELFALKCIKHAKT